MNERSVMLARVGVGLFQGLFLLALSLTQEGGIWPATDAYVFAPLLVVAVFVPTIAVSSIGHLRPATLAVWLAAAAVICVTLAAYDVFRGPLVDTTGTSVWRSLYPNSGLWLALAAVLFIVHALTLAAEADRRMVASYPTYFDVSWKLGVQIVLAQCFVALLLGLLFLGGELFRLIKIELPARLVRDKDFIIPVAAVTFSYALHVTDSRAGIVHGARTLLLMLLSWLLPVMAVMAGAFVLALPLTGLEPLWDTRRAATILLSCAAILIFLINATYQDGSKATRAASVLRYASLLGTAVLVPLTALSAYAIKLRVEQYGWTPDRIAALACVVVIGCYGLGYVLSALRSGVALRGLEATNLLTSVILVGVIIALRTPIADPVKISVRSQVARLESGHVQRNHFDFTFLRFNAGRYGTRALEKLVAGKNGLRDLAIAERASEVLQAKSPWDAQMINALRPVPVVITPELRSQNITVVYPKGGVLPDSFVRQEWKLQGAFAPPCLARNFKCLAVLADLDDDGAAEILVFAMPAGVSAAFKQGGDGTWSSLGSLANGFCAGVREALKDGQFELEPPRLKDIGVGGQRLRITPACEPKPAAAK